MKKIVCKNAKGNQIYFSYSFPFFLEDCSGIHEISANVSTVKSAFGVGTVYVGTSVNERNIVITGSIEKNNVIPARKLLYKLFPLGEEGTFYYYEDEISRKISYYVDSLKITKGTILYKFQISLLCPNPYFTDLEETSVSMANWNKKFKFPLCIPDEKGIRFADKNTNSMISIENDTNIEIGMRIIFTASSNVINPTLINVNTQERLTINKKMSAGDKIIITTYRNNKNIIFISNGKRVNINNFLLYGTKFLQIHCGSNTFKYEADSGSDNLTTEIYYLINYEGV